MVRLKFIERKALPPKATGQKTSIVMSPNLTAKQRSNNNQ